MPQLIVFDLDGTLAGSKVPITSEMGKLVRQLLEHYQVGVTSGAAFVRFEYQLLKPLRVAPARLAKLHLLPTDGTACYQYNQTKRKWQLVYHHDLHKTERAQITSTIRQVAVRLGLWSAYPAGPIIEDRGSQVTYSALGQQAKLKDKTGWDPAGTKRGRLRRALAKLLPGYSVKSAGLTSIDVTKAGEDKATGITRLADALGIPKAEVVYVGDALSAGGNDEVVKAAGFRVLAVKNPNDTAKVMRKFLHVAV